ncbi:MAG: hypothetical protein ACLP70_09390, partial [Streptosporangiaceae bacterium]
MAARHRDVLPGAGRLHRHGRPPGLRDYRRRGRVRLRGATQADCPVWMPFPRAVAAGPYRQVLGEGCVYPAAVPTLGNQLSAAGRSWAAYLQDMGNDPARDHTVATARGPACGHPATWVGDHTQKAEKGDQYAARHDGFTFFRSVTANQAFCAAHIVSFRPL